MMIQCGACAEIYDDAERLTYCPHERLMEPEYQRRKDLAIAMIGHDICFAHQPEGPSHRIQSVGWNGMVTLAGMVAEFSPDLFIKFTARVRIGDDVHPEEWIGSRGL